MAEAKPNPNPDRASPGAPSPEWIEAVRQHVAGLRYGVVQITVHAGKVVQVERTERFRFEGSATPTPGTEST